MRPVTKGSARRLYGHWTDARDDLIEMLGSYCSYCERRTSLPHVEHKEPKNLAQYEHRALDWSNFLLACEYCNPLKTDKDVRARPVLFPDEKNTAWAFEYLPSGFVRINPDLTDPADRKIAEDTKEWLLQLNRVHDTNGNVDRRWADRLGVWQVARASRDNLAICNTSEMRSQIVLTAHRSGCF